MYLIINVFYVYYYKKYFKLIINTYVLIFNILNIKVTNLITYPLLFLIVTYYYNYLLK
jgi:hypothetical protein